MKTTLLVALMLIVWSVPGRGETFTLDYSPELNDLPKIEYEIGQTFVKQSPNYSWGTQNSLLLVMRLIDWRQTLQIATEYETIYVAQKTSFGDSYLVEKEVPKYKEANLILGEHPTESEVNQYFLAIIGLDLFLHYKALNNPKWIKINNTWIKFNTVVSIGCVGNNFRLGINLN